MNGIKYTQYNLQRPKQELKISGMQKVAIPAIRQSRVVT